MIINDKYRFIFYHIPKNAGTSVRTFLEKLDGNVAHGIEAAHEEPSVFVKKLNYLKWGIVRDPWARMESAFKYFLATAHGKRKWGDRPFYEFVEDIADFYSFPSETVRYFPVFKPQMNWIPHLDVAIRCEDLEAGIFSMGQELGFQVPNRLPMMNISQKGRPKWSKRALEVFEDYYGDDIGAMSYTFTGEVDGRV